MLLFPPAFVSYAWQSPLRSIRNKKPLSFLMLR